MPKRDFLDIDQCCSIVVWNVSDRLEEMLEQAELSESRLAKYNTLSEKRKKEYLGLRLCLKALGADQEVLYDEKGKPYLESDHNISITHSYDKVCVGISTKKIGIDIELNRPKKIANIRKKFVRQEEEDWLISRKDNLNDYLHIIWGVKEGLYKLNGGNLWNFLNHYKVDAFDLNEPRIRCWISDSRKSAIYKASYKKIDDYYLTWVVDDQV